MYIDHAVAPSYEELRPFKRPVTDTFPVYPELAGELVTAKAYPDERVAHVLATCSAYAYSTADTVSTIMARMGLERNHCLLVGQYVDAMFINSTAFLVQSEDGRVVILAYRGTEPTKFITWLTDFDVYPDRVGFDLGGNSGSYDVHAGFYRNVRATRYEIVNALGRALQGRSVLDDGRPRRTPLPNGGRMENPLEALYVTGHSLGGAMASILTLMLHSEPAYTKLANVLRATYTFGQPMVGSPRLAAAADRQDYVRDRVIRYVYRKDVVAHLPPWGTGEFAHFGQEFGYQGKWQRRAEPTGQMLPLGGLLLAAGDFVARQHRLLRLLPAPYSLNDHLPRHYVTALTPPGTPTEFGDYFPAGEQ